MLSTIACCLEEPEDVVALTLVSRRCRRVCKSAALGLCLQSKPGRYLLGLTSYCGTLQRPGSKAMFKIIIKRVPSAGVESLDLRGATLSSEVIGKLFLSSFPSLRHVNLSGAHKVDSQLLFVLRAFASSAGMFGTSGDEYSGCAVHSRWSLTPGAPEGWKGVQTISLQRCFQLSPSALTSALLAARLPKSRLATVLLSHLELDAWPAESQSLPTGFLPSPVIAEEMTCSPKDLGETADIIPEQLLQGQPTGTSALRVLALHNCKKLTSQAMAAIATAAPRLQALLLGGSRFAAAAAEPGTPGLAGFSVPHTAIGSVMLEMHPAHSHRRAAGCRAPLQVGPLIPDNITPGSLHVTCWRLNATA